jgi:hypothetical protein
MSWIAKMWHFGQDALTSYSGEKFDMNWENRLNVFCLIYSKEYVKKKMIVKRDLMIPKQANRR